jgi:hypothetical protein
VPLPLVVTDEPPDPLIGATDECVGAEDDDEAGGVVRAGGVDVVALLLCVTVAA